MSSSTSSTYDIAIDELDESDEVAPQPSRSKIPLKKHQLTLLARCIAYERENISLCSIRCLQRLQDWQPDDYMRTRIGIMGDRPGSGKSFVILSLMLQDDEAAGQTSGQNFVKSYGCNKVVLSLRDAVRPKKTNLLVIPHNMCAQWDWYVKSFIDLTAFKHLMIKDARALHGLIDVDVEGYDLIITTSTCYNRVCDITTAKSIKFRRVIFDEVDSMSLPSCMAVDASFTWFVTASFGNLLYPRGYSGWDNHMNKYVWRADGLRNSGYVKNLFMDLYNNVSIDFVKILVVKNKDEFVVSSINLPPTVRHHVVCRTPTSINLLHGVVDHNIIESLNAGDVTTALQHVASSNKGTEENIVRVILDKLSRQRDSLETRLRLVADAPQETFESDAERAGEIARLQRRLDEVTSKMASIRTRIVESDTCCICFDTITHKTVTPCCSNSYCFRCINLWLARSSMCPLCKVRLVSSDLMVIQSAADLSSDVAREASDDEPSENYTKVKNLEIVLKKRMADLRQPAKILIFASFDNSFSQIVAVLDRLRIAHAYLKGNNEVIKNIVSNYKTGSLSVLLVNTRNYGSGLNLENTTDIIMFHKFDTEIEKQVIGRASRMGRTSPLHVWYLLHENEMTRASSASSTLPLPAVPVAGPSAVTST